MITCTPETIKAMMRTGDNAERFQVGLKDDEISRKCISQIALLEPGVECTVIILTKQEWEIMKGAFLSLNK